MNNDNEKPEKESIIKRPVSKGPASYVHSNIGIDKDGKITYESGYKALSLEEDKRIAKKYQEKLRAKAKEEEKKVASVSSKSMKASAPSTDKYNLYKRLNIKEEDKAFLLDVIKYSLTEREIKVLKSYFGSKYDGYYRSSCTNETKNYVTTIVNKLNKYLKNFKEALKSGKLNGRIYLLSIKAENKIEYIDPDVFKKVLKKDLNNVIFYRLTEEERHIFRLYQNQEDMSDNELLLFLNEIAPKMMAYLFERKSINAYLKAFTSKEKQVVKSVIAMFSLADKEILKKKFGPKYDGNNPSSLTPAEINRFNISISKKLKDKYEELLNYKDTTSYYLAVIKGFSSVNIEKHCNVIDDIDRKILLTLLEKLNASDLTDLFTNNQVGEKSRKEVVSTRNRILYFLKKSIPELKKVYNFKEEYNAILDKLNLDKPNIDTKSSRRNSSLYKLLAIDEDEYDLNYLLPLLLKEEEVLLLQKRFSSSYDMDNKENISLDEEKEIKLIVKTLKKIFKKYKIKEITKTLKEEKNISNDLEELISQNLNEQEILLLQKLYGSDYNSLNKEMVSKEELIIIYALILPKIPSKKQKTKKAPRARTLADYLALDEEKKKYLNKAITILTEEELAIVYKKFGPNLDGINTQKLTKNEAYSLCTTIKDNLLHCINVLINTDEKDQEKELNTLRVVHKMHYRVISLYDLLLLTEEKSDLLNKVINEELTEQEILLLQKRFGPSYNGEWINCISSEENKKILTIIIPKLKAALAPKNNKTKKTRKVNKGNYQTKSLLKFLNLNDEDKTLLELAIKTLNEEEIRILKKKFGELYDGQNGEILSQKERNSLYVVIKPKLLNTIDTLKNSQENRENIINKLISKNKFGYRNLSLYEALGISEKRKDILTKNITSLCEEKIALLQRRFGPSYDGLDIKGVTKEENNIINIEIIPFLKIEIAKELGDSKETPFKGYRVESLFEYLQIEDDKQYIILDVINVFTLTDQELLQKRFGIKYAGGNTKPINKKEYDRILKTLIPYIKDMYQVLCETSIEEYSSILSDLSYKCQIKMRNREKDKRDFADITEESQVKTQEDISKTNSENIRGVKVIKMEEVNVEEEKTSENDIFLSSITNLLKILEDEKGISQVKVSLEEIKEGIDKYSKTLELCTLGFTKEEALFLFLGSNESISLSDILAYLYIDKETLNEIYESCCTKISALLSKELDDYITLVKEKGDLNE